MLLPQLIWSNNFVDEATEQPTAASFNFCFLRIK